MEATPGEGREALAFAMVGDSGVAAGDLMAEEPLQEKKLALDPIANSAPLRRRPREPILFDDEPDELLALAGGQVDSHITRVDRMPEHEARFHIGHLKFLVGEERGLARVFRAGDVLECNDTGGGRQPDMLDDVSEETVVDLVRVRRGEARPIRAEGASGGRTMSWT